MLIKYTNYNMGFIYKITLPNVNIKNINITIKKIKLS